MRIALAYAVSDLSLKDVAAWASALQLAEITGPGLFYRLRQAEQWLEQVLGRVLSDQVPQAAGGLRVRVVDATVLNGPGQKAVQWRAHVSIDPSSGSIRAVELTDDSGGEKFSRHHFRAHEVVLGDRAYATARGLYAVRQQEAHAVVRFNPATLRTCDEKRRRIYLAEKEPGVPKVGAIEFAIKIPVPPTTHTQPQDLGLGQGHRLDFRPCHCRTHPDRRGDLDSNHSAAPANADRGHLWSLSGALADRTRIQAPQVFTASGRLAFSRRSHREKLDAGTVDRGSSGPEDGATFRPTFPLGL
jgi:hypothetical protein